MEPNDNGSEDIGSELVGEHVRIYQRGRTWYANFQLDRRQRRQSLHTSSKKEARRRAIQLEAEILQGRYRTVAPPPPLKTVIEEYVEFLKTERRAPKTMTKYVKVFERVLALAEQRRVGPISGVDLKFVDAFRSQRVQAGVAPKTLFTETVIVRQVVNFALSRGHLHEDPLKGLLLKKPKSAPQPCWTAAEVEKILQASPEKDRGKFLVLADSGMRVGELRHLSWDDVDLENNVLHIRPKEGWTPKTGDQRSIPISARVRDLLLSLPRRSRWVFPASLQKASGHESQFSDRRLLVSLKKVVKGLGLPGHVHTFRHAFISRALTQGIPEAIVRTWVGHVDDDVIRLYTHIADESSQAAMQRLAGLNQGLQPEARQDGARTHEDDSAQIQHSDGGGDDAAIAS